MKLKVIREYHDAVSDEVRKPGDILTADDERGKVLIAARVCEAMPEAREAEAPEAKPAAKRTAARKTAKK